MESFKKILALCPHTDDGELGCGATIAKFVQEGKEVFYTAFSSAEQSLPEGFPKDTLKNEVAQATKVLGIKPENLTILDYPVRNFPEHRQAILEDLVKLRKEINPDLVFLPASTDVHQDHQVIAHEGFRAFKGAASILGYELPWNNPTFSAQAFVTLEGSHLALKAAALSYYKSQAGRFYMSQDFVISLAKVRGVMINRAYAEAFEAVRWVMR